MFGNFKRMKNGISRIDITAMHDKHEDEKPDKKFILAVIILSVLALVTLIRAFYDSTTRAQLLNLKISVFDIIVFIFAVVGYIFLRKRGRK
ncbi:MAG: hypothetical protein K6C68_05105 [Ruminococcus sp.]|nr:hypothetical protein [Ruminococcus sp.]